MSSRWRILWTRLSRLKLNYRPVPLVTVGKIPKYSTPASVGFSIFTWLGFSEDKKRTPEDDLINTIKHCVLFVQRGQYEKAEQLLHIALRQAQQLHHHLGITYIYDVMANLALEREQLDKAKKLFVVVSQRIMAEGATEDDFKVVHISAKLARISHLQKDYSTAQLGYDWCLEKLSKAFKTEQADVALKLMAMTEDWYGRLFLDCGQQEKGLNLMIKSLDKMREVKDVEPEHIVIQLNDIGTVCDQVGRYNESISYLKEAIEVGKKLEMEDVGAFYVNLGRVYIKQNLLDDARKNCGFGWKLGIVNKNDKIKEEAESCMQEIKNHS